MTLDCQDCSRVRKSESAYVADGGEMRCGLRRVSRPLCEVMRSDDGECGPDGKLFAPKHGADA